MARSWLAALVAKGDKLLTAPVSQRVLVGPRLLAVSREVLDRISDWNPSHFLDVAEMTHAFAIGYDWLYQDLSPADRDAIRRALVDKGLKPAKQAYEAKAWWTVSAFNWNNVCNGGILVGALAVGDEEPELARYLAYRAVINLPRALASYAPDGAWAEGPGYWGYATRYTVAAFAALHSDLGTDFGLSADGLKQPGGPEMTEASRRRRIHARRDRLSLRCEAAAAMVYCAGRPKTALIRPVGRPLRQSTRT